MDKKAISPIFFAIVFAVVAIVAGIVMTSVATGGIFSIKDIATKDIDSISSDCDLDFVQNRFDDCPCLPYASAPGKTHPESLIGCPLKTTRAEAAKDKATCHLFQLDEQLAFDGKPLNNLAEECPEEQKKAGGCRTRCEIVSTEQLAKEIDADGARTKGDIKVINFEVGGKIIDDCDGDDVPDDQDRCPCYPTDLIGFDNRPLSHPNGFDGCPGSFSQADVDEAFCEPQTSPICSDSTDQNVASEKGKVKYNLGGKNHFHVLPVRFALNNVGNGPVVDSFTIKVEVCKNNNADDCQVKKSFRSYGNYISNTKGQELHTFTEMIDIGIQTPVLSFFIPLGTDGDYCQGEGDKECWVQVKADASSNLAEINENNNIAGAQVRLENKGSSNPVSLIGNVKKVIHLVEEDGGPTPVKEACTGYVGNPDKNDREYYCPAKTACEGDFNYPRVLSDTPGCWVAISQGVNAATDYDDCGLAVMHPGFMLNKADRFEDREIAGHDGPPDSKEILKTKTWSPPTQGSLLCSDRSHDKENLGTDNWVLCNEQTSGATVQLKNGKEYVCNPTNLRWKQR